MTATKEVGQAIAAIQKDVQGNITLVDESTQAVDRAATLAGASTTSLGEIMTTCAVISFWETARHSVVARTVFLLVG